tara:strand:- start:817 stop:1461 length:645 start_codon:yes stop_codon:yes gene_type:complete
MIALELVNHAGDPIDYLAFPVMPSELKRMKQELTTIKNTMGGIVSLSTKKFIPIQFSLSGTFGRMFRVVLRGSNLTFAGLRYSSLNGVFKKGQINGGTKSPQFNTSLKTGYGVTKVLESILEKSTGLDQNNKPFRLYFYNPAFNESYMIKVVNSQFSQDEQDSNMMWKYSLSFAAIAPLEDIVASSRKELAKRTSLTSLYSNVTTVMTNIKKYL